MSDFNQALIAEYRATAGEITGPYAGAELLLLHTVGAKSGDEKVSPITYRREGDVYYVFASYAGNANNPAWYHNLLAHPDTTIEVGASTISVHAAEVRGEERDRIYDQHAQKYTLFTTYPSKTTRTIPVIALTPTDR